MMRLPLYDLDVDADIAAIGMSPEGQRQLQSQRNRCRANDEGTELVYAFDALSEDDVTLLAAGIVPKDMEIAALRLLNFDDRVRRNAEKPVKAARTP